MAQLKCGFCQGSTFELTTEHLQGARFPLAVVRRLSCDVPIGILQMEDPVPTIRQAQQSLADQIRQVEERLKREIADIGAQLAPP